RGLVSRGIPVNRKLLLPLLLAAALPVAAGAAELPAWQAKLDPRLVAWSRLPGSDPEPVWVELADKGERDPADLAARLAAAAAALTPRARARRLRAQVRPLVDYLDLPLHAPYLEALAAQGFRT